LEKRSKQNAVGSWKKEIGKKQLAKSSWQLTKN
jgi:hypothetical protein